jgi:hypothetical protein
MHMGTMRFRVSIMPSPRSLMLLVTPPEEVSIQHAVLYPDAATG